LAALAVPGRGWRGGAPPPRLLLDYYALVGTFIVMTTYLPIARHLPRTWANLAAVPYMQLVLLLGPALAWFAACLACRWVLRSGLSRRGRTLWWLSLGLAVLAWLPCKHCHVAGQ
jgi:hypothetical protein